MKFSLLSVISTALSLSIVVHGAPAVESDSTSSCKNPLIRREWRKLSTNDRLSYISAVKCLQSKPSKLKTLLPGSGSRFEDYQGAHIVMTDYTHFVGHFQAWHRYLVHIYETELRSLCGYKGTQPYWDWTLDTKTETSIYSSPVFDNTTGFGGNGPYVENTGTPGIAIPGRTGGGCVPGGPFKDLVLNMGPGKSVVKNPQCLTRDFSLLVINKALTTAQVTETLSKPDFAEFDISVQGGITFEEITYHGGGHLGIGGELGTIADVYSSPGDPLFYLHHAQLDRLWWQWQQKDPVKRLKDIAGPDTQFAHPWAFFGEIPYQNITLATKLNMTGLAEDKTVKDVMNIQGGLLCYDYV